MSRNKQKVEESDSSENGYEDSSSDDSADLELVEDEPAAPSTSSKAKGRVTKKKTSASKVRKVQEDSSDYEVVDLEKESKGKSKKTMEPQIANSAELRRQYSELIENCQGIMNVDNFDFLALGISKV